MRMADKSHCKIATYSYRTVGGGGGMMGVREGMDIVTEIVLHTFVTF